MLRKYVTARNISATSITILDRRLSMGKLTLAPGDEFGLPNDIWMDHRRRYLGRLVDISTLAPVAETVPFAPTHMLGDTAVMIGEITEKRVYFTLSDGSNSFRKKENFDAEAVEIGADDDTQEGITDENI
jgi:hypothetical protein